LLGLKFLYFLNKYQNSAQAKIANVAAKIAEFGVSSIGKTCQNQSRRLPNKQENRPLSEQMSRRPMKFIFLLCTHRS